MNTSPKKMSLGFTLIEMIVSLGVFAVVVTITTGALITLIAGNQRFQREQTITTNLAFALDSMTREIRSGFNYYCASGAGTPFGTVNHEVVSTGAVNDAGVGNTLLRRDCSGGRGNNNLHGISFYEGGNSITTGAGVRRILYYVDMNAETLYRRVGNDAPESIISGDIRIVNADFFVTSTQSLLSDNDVDQPAVTIHIEAASRSDTTGKTYLMQTTVSQRPLDL
jgi:prepilin-type N-terminal cleavage/methylation domain-containing protein